MTAGPDHGAPAFRLEAYHPLSEDELLEAYGVATGTPVEVHAAILDLRRQVDVIARSLAEVLELLDLLVDDAVDEHYADARANRP